MTQDAVANVHAVVSLLACLAAIFVAFWPQIHGPDS